MSIKEKLKKLVSSKEEFDQLYNTDYVYIVKGNHPDDNGLFDIEVDHWDWKVKLRGEFEGPAKLANNKNNMDWMHGFVWGVTEDEMIKFEKSAVISSLITGYRFEKISVILEKELKDNTVFDSLFDGAE
jgi:hypothetical protein